MLSVSWSMLERAFAEVVDGREVEGDRMSLDLSNGGMRSSTPLTMTNANASQNDVERLRIGYLKVPSAHMALSLKENKM